jgi:RHS repeat-associated protein
MTAAPIQCQSDPRFVGDPIDVVTGSNTDVITDLAQRGPIPFKWTRYYSSARSGTHCSLGWGHSHGFDCLLIRDLDGLRYQDPFGASVRFGVPAYGDTAAAGMVLRWTAADSYVIAESGQPDQEFQFSPGSDVARLARLRRGDFTIDLHYTATGALREIVDSRGRLIRVSSDQAGRVLKLALVDRETGREGPVLLAYEYDQAGNLIRATDLYRATLSFAYDAGNRMTRRTDRRGYSFHFEYDDEGRCIHSRGDDGLFEVFLGYEPNARTTFVRRGDGGRWIYTYDHNGAVTEITDPYGGVTKFILDDLGRPVQERDPNGNATVLHYNWQGGHDYRIDPNGNVLPTKAADPAPLDPLAYELPRTALEWDFGRLVDAKTIRPPQASDPLLAHFPAPVVNTVLGKTATYDATAMATATLPATAEQLQTDDLGRPLEYTGPRFREQWKYDANGNLVEHRDRDGSVSRFVYKSWNALSQSIDALGNTTSYDLTVQGLMARTTDAGGTVTEYGYDLREKLVEVRENGRLVERYRRDAAGNVIEKTAASGRTLVTWEVGPGNLDKVQVLGSGEKHVFEYGPRGRVIMARTPADTATFVYDEEGNLLADQRDGKGVVHEFELKQLVATTYFDKFKVEYRTLDNGDFVVQDPTGAQHRFQFGATGLIIRHLANGARELCQFDDDGRCRRKAVTRGARDSAPWMRSYAYSAAGDLASVADTKAGVTKYRFDAAHRLIEETPPWGPPRRFGHDAAGNLVLQPGLTNVVVGERNRLKGANGESFTYNDRCHLGQRQGPSGTVRYEYNDLDMLVRCDVNGEAWTASYDGLCRRVNKTWQGQTTTYYWDDFRLAAEARHDGSCRLYIYADDTALAPFLFLEYDSPDAAPESGTRYYVFTNQVGAPIRVEDDAGQPVWSARIDPYGKAQVDPGSRVNMPLRFPGHYFDQETGLHYNRFRYFSPELGRYLQSDPAGQIGGINVYAYPSNPLTGVDIDGLSATTTKKPRKQPKAKSSKIPEVGCKKDLPPGLSDEQVKAELEKKAKAMQNAMYLAQEAGHKEVRAPDGTIIKVGYSTMGPCLSLVYDKKTGNVRYGQNVSDRRPSDPNKPRQQKLREPLQQRADQAAHDNRAEFGDLKYTNKEGKEVTPQYGMRPMNGVPGEHSEVRAMNEAMKDRDAQHEKDPFGVPPPKPEDYRVYNQILQPHPNKDAQGGEAGQGKPCCPDCKKITQGATDVSRLGEEE